MGKIVKNGVTYSGSSDNADNVKYNNNVSNLDATNVQEAIDKLDESVDDANGRLTQVQTQIVPTASIESGETASKAYNIGDFLVKDGILYKVIQDIAEGDALTVGENIDSTTVVDELNSSDTFIKKMKLLGRSSDSNVVNLNESFKNYDAIYISSFSKASADLENISTSIFAFSEDINVGDKIKLLDVFSSTKYVQILLTISSDTSFTIASSLTKLGFYITVIGINL